MVSINSTSYKGSGSTSESLPTSTLTGVSINSTSYKGSGNGEFNFKGVPDDNVMFPLIPLPIKEAVPYVHSPVLLGWTCFH